MKKVLFVIFLVLVACQPVVKPELQAVAVEKVEVIEPVGPEVAVIEKVVEPNMTEEPVLANVSFDIAPNGTIGCVDSIAPEDFAVACGLDASDVSVTFRGGTKNCLVSVRHSTNRNANGHVELTRYESDKKAAEEFDRRLKVRLVGASDSDIPGARTYEFDMVGMHSIEFLRGPDIIQVQSSVEFCPEDKLMDFARTVSTQLK